MKKLTSNISGILDIIKEMENIPIYIDDVTLGKVFSLEIQKTIYLTLRGKKDYHSLNMTSYYKPDTLADYILITQGDLDEELDIHLAYQKKWIVARTQTKGELNNEAMFYAYIKFDEIIHITTDTTNNVKIFTDKGVFTKRETLKKLLEILPYDFVQVEKRDIVNLAFLVGLNPAKSIIFIKDNETVKRITVGNKYKEILDSKLKNGLIV